LGYDWKIGIAIISSFAARGFVGTLATIYSVGGSDNEVTIKNKMAAEINPVTGEKIFNFASGISLLLFYAFAMQCASTLAVTKKKPIPGRSCRTIDLHVWLCLCSRVNHLSNAKIGNLNTCH
jgi:Fe2+ transport system protein B